MPKEAITERLKFLTEMIRLAFIAFLAIGGGAISLLLGPYDLLRVLLVAAGILTSIGAWGADRKADKKGAETSSPIRGALSMLYDIFAVVGVAVILGTLVWALSAAIREPRPPSR